MHSGFGKIGEASVGGVEIIGVDGEAYHSTFYDSFGNVHRARLEIEGDVIRWIGDRARCRLLLTCLVCDRSDSWDTPPPAR